MTMSDFIQVLKKFFGLSIPRLEWNDVLEILLLAVMIYYVILWIKRNRAWTLLKGIAMLVAFSIAAYVLRLTTISWILSKLLNAGLLAILILFQPELRKALEELGRKNPIGNWFNLDESRVVDKSFSNETIDAIVKATFDMGKVKTGALIVIEQEYDLTDYIKTGIELDAMISSQLLVQIFEHNTPLHDGAAIIRGNRIVSATCYLPLSNNMDISKELGTRHRAGLGISEVTDSVTIIASEETGKISLAVGGQLSRDLDAEALQNYLKTLQKTPSDSHRLKLWKGRQKDEKKSD